MEGRLLTDKQLNIIKDDLKNFNFDLNKYIDIQIFIITGINSLDLIKLEYYLKREINKGMPFDMTENLSLSDMSIKVYGLMFENTIQKLMGKYWY